MLGGGQHCWCFWAFLPSSSHQPHIKEGSQEEVEQCQPWLPFHQEQKASQPPSILQCELRGFRTGHMGSPSHWRIWAREQTASLLGAGTLLPHTKAGLCGRGRERWGGVGSWDYVLQADCTSPACKMPRSEHPTLSLHALAYDGVDLCTTWSYKFFISFV